jgi:hypothetical protein
MRNRFSDEISEQLATSCAEGQLDLRLLAYLGHMAPSVHNTQPWILSYDQSLQIMEITPCQQRLLAHSDPTGRQAWISIGALLQNIVTVASNLPIRFTVNHHKNMLRLTFHHKSARAFDEDRLRDAVAVILHRRSNRNYFKQERLPKNTSTKLGGEPGSSSSVKTIFVTDSHQIEQLAELTRRASLLAFSSAKLRKELATHINPPFSRRLSGIPALSVSSSAARAFFEKPLTNSTRFISKNATIEYQRMLHSPLLVCVFTRGDTQSDWLNAGREYERLCLRATELDLSHSTTAALVEAPEYYKDVAKLLGTGMRVQAVMRVGHAKQPKSRAKRLVLEDVLATSSQITNNPS